MPAKEYAHTERFCAALSRIFEHVRGFDLLKGMREKAFDHFLELGLPEKSQEAFQYVPLRLLYENDYRAASKKVENPSFTVLAECRKSYLVFIGGRFAPELSDISALPSQVVVLPFFEAMRSYGAFLQNRWSQALKEESDPFAILNLACHPQGAFIYVPPKMQIETPLQCVNISEEGALSMPRLQMFLSSGSKLSCIVSTEGKGWTSGALDAALEDSASLHLTSWTTKFEGWLTSALRATLKRSSSLHHVGALAGGFCKRESFKISLKGENAEASLQGGWILSEKNHAHAHVVMEHAAPYCRSMQKFKGVVSKEAQSSFQGKILVRKEAQKTEAYQLSNNLIVGEYAAAYAKPGLEIFADDVKASHGATVAQISDKELFYLTSRGISKAAAQKLLVGGFCREVFEKIPYSLIRQEMEEHARQIE